MISATRFAVVLVTVPDVKTARRLAKLLLKARLIACANLLPQMESHYWWRGRIESGAEVMLMLKTARTRLAALEKAILANHPYDTPEIIALPIIKGNARYLRWLSVSVAARR